MTTPHGKQLELLEANKIVIKGNEFSVLQGKRAHKSLENS